MPTNQWDSPNWPAKLVELLGRQPDAKIAAKLKVSTEAVRRKRQELNVPAYRRESVWTDERDALLGTAADTVIAKTLGVTPLAVRIRRHRLGVAPYTGKE